MKNKLLLAGAFFISCLLLISGCIPAYAKVADKYTVTDIEDIRDGILATVSDGTAQSVQSIADKYLADDIGGTAEWYAIALSQTYNVDLSSYGQALASYVRENEIHSASTRLKLALTLSAVGSTDEYILQTLDDSVGKMGIMSYVFGLHILNNGYKSEIHSTDTIKDKLLSMQLQNGGWAVMGESADVDVTAMTLQALSPYYESDESVRNAVDRALEMLSYCQLPCGGYQNYGKNNTESAAQVTIALCGLGIDIDTDERFIKNGNTVLDGMLKYLCDNGEFSHDGGEPDESATVQAFFALSAYLRAKDGKGSLYILDNADPENARIPNDSDTDIDVPDGTENSEPDISEDAEQNDTADKPKATYKLWACIISVCAALMLCVILFILRRLSFKNVIAILIILAAVIAFFVFTDISSPSDHYNEDITRDGVIGQVSMTIRCDTIAGRDEHIPSDGVILDVTELDICEGDTPYTVLADAARKYKIQYENSGSTKLVYISGINYIYEFDFGDLSGWVYTVNGKQPSVGAGEYKLKPGDVIEWHYTLNLGEDIKNNEN